MKQFLCIGFFFSLIILFSNLNAQIKRSEGVDFRVKINISPYVEYSQIKQQPGFLAGMGGAMVVDDRILIGLYGTKKINRTYIEYEMEHNPSLDANYQHFGFWLGGSFGLGLKKRKGRYIKRKTRLFIDLKAGGGSVWMDNEQGVKSTCRDYFYTVTPGIAFTRPVSRTVDFDIGFNYYQVLKINKLDGYLKNEDFSGPGGYIGLRFNLFTQPKFKK